ncbi:MAG: hypothetical protein V4555_18365 [Acidobacteriota bacterium]
MPTQVQPLEPAALSRLLGAIAHAHDLLFSEAHKMRLKFLVIKISVAGFALHLALIFLARTLAHPPAVIAAVGQNYLAAIPTPFDVILFYEILTLIAALPASTARSIANQFEIVSLIYLRGVFHKIAMDTDLVLHQHVTRQSLPLFIDMGAGLLMFLLVAVFQYIADHRIRPPATEERFRGLEQFTNQKKVVAMGLALLLLAMTLYDLGHLTLHIGQLIAFGQSAPVAHLTTFYNDLFTIMIFTDVLILILSLAISGRYEMVFRNAAFVVSIILIRFSLTEEPVYGAPLALAAMLFAILTVAIFSFHMRLQRDNPNN